MAPDVCFAGKTAFITGSSRGIGKAIALRLAQAGANVAIVAKTTEVTDKFSETIYSTAEEIKRITGAATVAIKCDIRNESEVEAALLKTYQTFGSIDIVVNNASAISLTDVASTPMKKYDLINGVNARGTYLVTKAALPYLMRSGKNAHVLMISPPLSMNPKWFARHTAYTIAKYGMSMCVLGMSAEFRPHKIAVNALWPKTVVATAALTMIPNEGSDGVMLSERARKPQIIADAAVCIFAQDSATFTGQFLIDEQILRKFAPDLALDKYAVNAERRHELITDLFVEEDVSESDGLLIAAINAVLATHRHVFEHASLQLRLREGSMKPGLSVWQWCPQSMRLCKVDNSVAASFNPKIILHSHCGDLGVEICEMNEETKSTIKYILHPLISAKNNAQVKISNKTKL